MSAITSLFQGFKKLLQILTFGIDPCQSGYNQIEKYSPPPPASFGRSEDAQRLYLVEKLVKAVSSPTRLGGVGQ